MELKLNPNHEHYLAILFKEGAIDEIRDHILNNCTNATWATLEHEKIKREQYYLEGMGAIKFYQIIKAMFDRNEEDSK